ncbi:MAG TPA: zf-HC2 domain-containing protein [Candidatus Polarisedimenticolia bacterium]|nr:zf-HC2 domain-containing protein [Candidatus Polarisedimenticolia bacterium]
MSDPQRPAGPGCREVFGLLSDYVDGELSPETRGALEEHLGACPPCERFLKTFQKTRALCRENLLEEMPDELRTRLHSFLKDRIRGK